MLHNPEHTAKAFSVPRGERLVLLMVPDTFLFWVRLQGLQFQSCRVGKALLNCTPTSNNHSSESASRAARCAPAGRPGQGGLASLGTQAAKCWSGDIKGQERQQEGGWKPASCNKNSSLPKGSPAHSMGLSGARAEGDGSLREERDGPCNH